jgi:hypothetical protein
MNRQEIILVEKPVKTWFNKLLFLSKFVETNFGGY